MKSRRTSSLIKFEGEFKNQISDKSRGKNLTRRLHNSFQIASQSKLLASKNSNRVRPRSLVSLGNPGSDAEGSGIESRSDHPACTPIRDTHLRGCVPAFFYFRCWHYDRRYRSSHFSMSINIAFPGGAVKF